MMTDQPSCGHRHIVSLTVHDGPLSSDRWECRDCKTEFVPVYPGDQPKTGVTSAASESTESTRTCVHCEKGVVKTDDGFHIYERGPMVQCGSEAVTDAPAVTERAHIPEPDADYTCCCAYIVGEWKFQRCSPCLGGLHSGCLRKATKAVVTTDADKAAWEQALAAHTGSHHKWDLLGCAVCAWLNRSCPAADSASSEHAASLLSRARQMLYQIPGPKAYDLRRSIGRYLAADKAAPVGDGR